MHSIEIIMKFELIYFSISTPFDNLLPFFLNLCDNLTLFDNLITFWRTEWALDN